MEFGETVTYIRRKAKLTQEQLADKVKISVQYLNQIEKGRALHSIGQDIIQKINEVLNIDPDEIKKLNSDSLNKSTLPLSSEDGNKMFEIERENWSRMEATLRDIIKRQDDRINELSEQVQFLKGLLEKK